MANDDPVKALADYARAQGLVVARTRSGFAFRCECGRQQSYAPPDVSGGVTVAEAKSLGWRRAEGGPWTCPFCTGAATADEPAWGSSDLEPLPEGEHGGGA
jgi:hypothetical protein